MFVMPCDCNCREATSFQVGKDAGEKSLRSELSPQLRQVGLQSPSVITDTITSFVHLRMLGRKYLRQTSRSMDVWGNK